MSIWVDKAAVIQVRGGSRRGRATAVGIAAVAILRPKAREGVPGLEQESGDRTFGAPRTVPGPSRTGREGSSRGGYKVYKEQGNSDPA
jgi:hypothetical protein